MAACGSLPTNRLPLSKSFDHGQERNLAPSIRATMTRDVATNDLEAVRSAIHEGVAPVVFKTATWDADPLRDTRLITEAVLSALWSNGFAIVRRDA